MRAPAILCLTIGLLLPPRLAMAAELLGVRVGDHPGHGRLVLDWSGPAEYSFDQQGERAVLRFPGAVGLDGATISRRPRNLLAVSAGSGGLVLSVAPGTVIRHFRIGTRLVLDLADPPLTRQTSAPPPEATPKLAAAGAERAPPTARAARQSTPRATEAALPIGNAETPRTRRTEARPVAAAAVPAPVAESPVLRATEPAPAPIPVPIAVERAVASANPLPRVEDAVAADPAPAVAVAPRLARAARIIAPPGRDRAVLLPFSADTAAAILRRGDTIMLAFDSADPIDFAQIRADPIFGKLETESLPGATVMRLPLAAPGVLRARRDAAGWVLEVGMPAENRDAVAFGRPIVIEADAAGLLRLFMRVAAPGRVVATRDPETGMPLFLGTVRQGGQAMTVGRRLPELDLPATMLGAAVVARADSIFLQSSPDRFTVTVSGGARFALDTAVTRAAVAPAMTRSFDLPAQPPEQVLQRVKALQAGISSAAPQSRLPQRRAVGEALLALGMPQEAQAMLAIGYAEDPRAAADPGYGALSAAAALLSGRLAETGGLRAAEVPATDEITLWRAALSAAQGESRAAAPAFGATLPLLLGYPKALRARLLPMAAFALGEAGDGPMLRRLLEAAGTDVELGLARAMLAEIEGKVEDALTGFDAVARGRDRLGRARAIRRAVELRLATSRIGPAQAAKEMEASLYAWRGDTEETTARLRIAALRQAGGDARGALALLRETRELFPETAPLVQAPIADAFVAALEADPPLAAISLFDAFPELLPAGARGDALVQGLAERLVALDLNDRAAALLRQAIGRASGRERAALGYRLATLRFADGDAAEAQAALSETATPDLDAALGLDRAILIARLDARRGQLPEAVAALRTLGAPAAEPLAEILADTQDWASAAAALATHLAAVLPPPPAALNAAEQRLILRQAALLALAGDERALTTLRATEAARLAPGPIADGFALLTADPLKGLADLPRLQRELQVFRRFPARLEAQRVGGPVTR